MNMILSTTELKANLISRRLLTTIVLNCPLEETFLLDLIKIRITNDIDMIITKKGNKPDSMKITTNNNCNISGFVLHA